MLSAARKPWTLHFLLAFILASTACAPKVRHTIELDVEFDGNHVLPSYARTKSGQPYSGEVRGTFGGEPGWLDCTEWEGRFKNGVPDGPFKLYEMCGELDGTYIYRNRHWERTAQH
jgi:hypothetical protein